MKIKKMLDIDDLDSLYAPNKKHVIVPTDSGVDSTKYLPNSDERHVRTTFPGKKARTHL